MYFTGNSLGLQPKTTRRFIGEELQAWKELGVEGHFMGRRPWLRYHQFSRKTLAMLAGANEDEVVSMNQLTVNLHLLLTSFYRPAGKRTKILMEAGAFPSDQYAIASHAMLHGLSPEKTILEISPRSGKFTLRTDDIVSVINKNADELALVILGAVQYYSGQFFDLKSITEAGHKAGAIVGFDLAHAIGNVPLQLHHDDVDFAAWCSYKYLNGGPGGVAGAFVHQRHANRFDLPRLAGWWGNRESDRFQMKKEFKPASGAEGWQVSNFPVLAGAAQLAALEIFKKAGLKRLSKKSHILTGYLYFLLKRIPSDRFVVITPEDPSQRGCQLSILIKRDGKKVFEGLTRGGVVADWREPDVIRIAPVPLYNTYEEVYRFVGIFRKILAR